ncbi:MAG: GntR family transcriptional regulator, partial [Thermodesulfobacteriota bacterium]
MIELFPPLQSDSLKDVFVARFEELILSGRISIGQKLPAERDLAQQLGVSRPVVHEGLVDLAAKGLVTLVPRRGTVVNDYRRCGSLALLNSLFSYHQGSLSPELRSSLLEMRELFEVETARLAARRGPGEQVKGLYEILAREEQAIPGDPEAQADLDFEFHHQVAMASGNLLYPLLLQSCRQVYTNLSRRFFAVPENQPPVLEFHRRLA